MLFSKIFFIIIFILNVSVAFSQENKKKCRINSNKQILDFIKKELKPLNSGSNEEGPRTKVVSIRPKDVRNKTLL